MYCNIPSAVNLLLACVLSFPVISAAAEVNPDSEASESWQLVRRSLFGDRTIRSDATRSDAARGNDTAAVINLRAPARAQDAAVVPAHRVPRYRPQSVSGCWHLQFYDGQRQGRHRNTRARRGLHLDACDRR